MRDIDRSGIRNLGVRLERNEKGTLGLINCWGDIALRSLQCYCGDSRKSNNAAVIVMLTGKASVPQRTVRIQRNGMHGLRLILVHDRIYLKTNACK